MATPPALGERERLFRSPEERVRDLIATRVTELREAIASRPVILSAGHAIDERLASILGRKLTEKDRSDAREAFEKALGYFVSEGAQLTGHPITELLKS